MMPAAKHLDPVVGIDTHIIMVPTPAGPVPTPLPHPYIGMIFDPMDYLPVVGATTLVNGLPRAAAGTAGLAIPPHIPMGGMFLKPPTNESEMFMGSTTVSVEGSPMSYGALPVISCQDVGIPAPPRPKKKSVPKSLMLPTTVVIPIPSGPPVVVGGAPIILMPTLDAALGPLAGGLVKALGKVAKRSKGLTRKLKKAKRQNPRCRRPGEPVDPVTGANVAEMVDFADPHGGLIWERTYDSSRAVCGPLGWGFRHCFQWELRLDRGRAVLTSGEGEEIAFPRERGAPHGGRAMGFELRSVDGLNFVALRGTDEQWNFRRCTATDVIARLVLWRRADVQIRCHHEAGSGRLTRITEETIAGAVTTEVRWEGDRIVDLMRQPAASPRYTLLHHRYDQQGRLVEVVNAAGHRSTYDYDAGHRLVAKTDANGYTFRFTYDDHGRCIEEAGQDGLWRVRLRYEAGRTIVTEADEGQWILAIDGAGTVTSITDPYGGVLVRSVGDDGRVDVEVEPGGRSAELLYDGSGHHFARIDPFGALVPPLDEFPNPPPGLDADPPATHLEQQLGSASFARLPSHDLNTMVPRPVWKQIAPFLPSTARSAAVPDTHHDQLGRLIRRRHPDGGTEEWTYDPCGNLIAYSDRDGARHRQEIGSWNLVLAEIDPLGHRTRFEYTAREQVAAIVDGGGSRIEYRYDERDRLIETRCNGRVRDRYRYGAADEVVEKLDSQGNALTRTTSGQRGLAMVRELASGEIHRFDYDDRGLPLEASTRESAVSLRWDEEGRRAADERDGVGVSHEYGDGQDEGDEDYLRSTTYFGRFRVDYRFDPARGLEIATPDGSRHWLRRGRHGTALLERGGGQTEVALYDREGRNRARVTVGGRGLTSSRPWYVRAHYSLTGELRALEDSARGVATFGYDAAHRLILERRQGKPEGVYTYDAAGNLLATPEMGPLRYTDGNRLLFAGPIRFELDDRDRIGARIAPDGTRTTYRYDSLDMLIEVSTASMQWTDAYDGLGRRTSKKVAGRTWRYYWDADRLAAEVNPDGRLRVYIYPSFEAMVPFMFVDYDHLEEAPSEGRPYHVFGNHQGAPVRIEDSTGQIVWEAERVAPYGALEIRAAALVDYDLRWPGHQWDSETALHYNRFRYYSPALGRYLQPDPAGQAGGINLYAYSANPVVDVDLLGLTHVKSRLSARPGRGKGHPPAVAARSGKATKKAPLVTSSRLPGVTVKERALAASTRNDRSARAARKKVVTSFLMEHGRVRDTKTGALRKPRRGEVKQQLRGHDYGRPVTVGPPPPCPSPQGQLQPPNRGKGQYFADPGTNADSAGIASWGRDENTKRYATKDETRYDVHPDAPYLESTAAPVGDDWSVPGRTIQTNGGAQQRVIPDRSMTAPVTP